MQRSLRCARDDDHTVVKFRFVFLNRIAHNVGPMLAMTEYELPGNKSSYLRIHKLRLTFST